MAYLAFPELGGIATGQGVDRPAARPDVVSLVGDRLTALEWSVVAIARRDGLATLRRPGRLSIAIGALFNHRNPMLADERLEALRRIAVLTWRYGYTVAPREVRAFLDAGFTPGQYETMVDSIAAARKLPPRTRAIAPSTTSAECRQREGRASARHSLAITI